MELHVSATFQVQVRVRRFKSSQKRTIDLRPHPPHLQRYLASRGRERTHTLAGNSSSWCCVRSDLL